MGEDNGGMNTAGLSTRQADALTALAYLLIGLLLYTFGFGRLVFNTGEDGASWLRAALLLALCATLTMRRSHPLPALLLGTAPVLIDTALGPSLPVWLAFGDLLYCATLYGRRAVGWVLLRLSVALAVGMTAAGAWYIGNVQGAILGLALVVLLALVPVIWALNIRTHRNAAQSQRLRAEAEGRRAEAERERADAERAQVAAEREKLLAEQARATEQARVASRDQAAAVTEERQRLARDLHDSVASHLGAIAIQSEAALRTTPDDSETRGQVLDAVRTNSVAALAEMQSMIELLRGHDDDVAATAPRLADLPELIGALHAQGTRVRLARDVPKDVDAEVDLTAYRICQEAMANATKHAPGSEVDLALVKADGGLVIEVENSLLARAPDPPQELARAAAAQAPRSAGAAPAAAVEAPPAAEPPSAVVAEAARAPSHDATRAAHNPGSSGGRGLGNMQQRAAAVGGHLHAGPTGKRWRVRAWLPVASGR